MDVETEDGIAGGQGRSAEDVAECGSACIWLLWAVVGLASWVAVALLISKTIAR